MILSFSREFPWGEPTDFEDKINASLNPGKLKNKPRPKIHTIRRDKTERWYEGMKIHFWMGSPRNPGPNSYQFASGRCEGVQKIVIDAEDEAVFVAGRKISPQETIWLAVNDGFESVEDFFRYFEGSKPFVGRLIHWTPFKY